MALRFLLVSLVASLGFELPDASDVATWARTGREWVGTRLAELSSIRDVVARSEVAPADCERADETLAAGEVAEAASGRADLAFDVVVEGMASSFAADLAALRADRPALDDAPDAIAASPELVPTGLAWSDPEPAPPAWVDEVEAPRGSRRIERLSAAVRLTRQAIGAWATLIEGSAESVADAR